MSDNFTQQNNSAPKSSQPAKSSNRKTLALVAVAVLVVGGLVTGAVMFNKESAKNADSSSNQVSYNSSTAADNTTSSTTAPVTASSSDSSSSTQAAPVDKPFRPAKVSQEIEEKREVLRDYSQEGKLLDVNLVSAEKEFNQETVAKIKENVQDTAPVIKAEAGKKVKITIKYTSIGDEDFKKGTLYVRLSQGLKLIPGSIEDKLDGGETIKVADSVYTESTNLIKYGPGSTDQTASAIKMGQKGQITMIVEVTDPNAKDLAATSFIQEEGGKAGKPGVIFIET